MDNYLATISRFVETAIKTPFKVILLTYGSKGGDKNYLSIPLTHSALDIENGYNKFLDEVDDIKRIKRQMLIKTIDNYLTWYKTNENKITELFGEKNVYSVEAETLGFIKGFAEYLSVKEKPKLSLPQIALIHIYTDKEPINRDNANRIAEKHGFRSKTSGDKLYQYFNKYYRISDRKGDEGTKRKNNNKITLLKSIIDYLPNNKQLKVKDEIKTLIILNKNTY